MQYLCYVTIPVAWLALALQISGRGEWLTKRNLGLLTIEPIITVAPAGPSLSGTTVTWSLFRFRLFNIILVAWARGQVSIFRY